MSVADPLPPCDRGMSLGDHLEQIEQSGFVKQGRVFLLSLEPIRAQLGARWPARENLIWDAVEMALERRIPPPDVFLRMNDTTVLAAIASTDGYEGQLRCVEALQTLFAFFLGRSMDEDIRISRVSSLSGGQLSAEPVSLVSAQFASGDTDDRSIPDSIASLRIPINPPSPKVEVIRSRYGTLSPREREVLSHVLTGSSSKVTAIALGISPRTVEVFRANILRKIKAPNLAAVATLMAQAGVICAPL